MMIIDEHIIMSALLGQATEEELAQLQEWIAASEDNARRYFEMEALHQGLLASTVPAEKVSAVMDGIMNENENVNENVNENGKRSTLNVDLRPSSATTRRSMFSILRYAAILVLGVVLGGGLIYKIGVDNEPKEVFVAKAMGGTQQMMLADGTKVWLHDGATLRYPETFADDERQVSLDGEAYFEVAKDAEHPFVVEGNVTCVRVLGTKFNYQTMCSDHKEEVALIEGSVDVSNKATNESVLLSPGQKASLSQKAGKFVVSKVNATLAAVWHDDFIPFENANLREIGDALEEVYGVKVSYASGIDMEKTYSGVIRRKDDVSAVLHLLQNTIPVRYKLQGENLTILPQ